MILVDPKVMENIKIGASHPYPIPDPLADKLSSLDHDIRTILETKHVPLDDKVLQYQQALQRYLYLAEQFRQRPLGKVELASPTLPPPLLAADDLPPPPPSLLTDQPFAPASIFA
ncbi:hypothetical protein BaRGS_00030222 [Batillaria attramentaria]|uniref:Uncharacterized protein n=1 Tax=Batillaria attramentaria TaxID=370345 RepID=A0ABD0JTY8_9CAEN